MFRRKALTMLASLPLLGFMRPPAQPKLPQLEIPEAALSRIRKLLAGGAIPTGMTFVVPPDKQGRIGSHTMFFTREEERNWQFK